MAKYVTLINWTEQGVQAFKDTLDRAEAARSLAERLGGSLTTVYWTVGPYDIVAIAEFPDDETATAFALGSSSQGNIRTTTLRAFDAEEMRHIVDRAS